MNNVIKSYKKKYKILLKSGIFDSHVNFKQITNFNSQISTTFYLLGQKSRTTNMAPMKHYTFVQLN